MADTDLTIALKGVEESVAQLATLSAAGQKTFADIGNAAKGLNTALGGGGATLPVVRQFEGATSAANRFREAIHVLHPILETAGLGMNNLGSFARVAGVGLGALGATIAASAVIGLERLSDRLALAVKRLKDLGASAGEIEKLKGLSSETGTSLADVATNFEKYTKARNAAEGPRFAYAPGREPTGFGRTAGYSTLQKLFTLGEGEVGPGNEALGKFLDQLGDAQRVTAKTAQTLPVGTAAAILRYGNFRQPFAGQTPQTALGEQLGIGGIPLPQLEARFNTPGINKDFAERVPTLTDSFGKLAISAQTLVGAFSPLAKDVSDFAEEIGKLSKFIKDNLPSEDTRKRYTQDPVGALATDTLRGLGLLPKEGQSVGGALHDAFIGNTFSDRFAGLPARSAPTSATFDERFGNFPGIAAPSPLRISIPARAPQTDSEIYRLQGLPGPITVPASSQGNISGYNANIDYRGGGQSSRSDAGGQELNSAGHAAGRTIADALISAASVAGQIIKSSQGSLTDDLTQSSIARQTGQGAVPPSWYR